MKQNMCLQKFLMLWFRSVPSVISMTNSLESVIKYISSNIPIYTNPFNLFETKVHENAADFNDILHYVAKTQNIWK
jgi:hypothetical protein